MRISTIRIILGRLTSYGPVIGRTHNIKDSVTLCVCPVPLLGFNIRVGLSTCLYNGTVLAHTVTSVMPAMRLTFCRFGTRSVTHRPFIRIERMRLDGWRSRGS